MPRFAFLLALLSLPLVALAGKDEPITIVSYYFGNYHPGDPRNVKTKGPDWSEWELVKNAKPRFPGHQQPHVPLWGYLDESKPEVMAQKIDAAADHGIDGFIFDWYYYDDGPFLDRPIDEGFLKAKNNKRLKFAFMWANHDWHDIFPARRGDSGKLLYPGRVKPDTFRKICNHLIADYFTRSNYWKIDGKPYFSIYEMKTLVDSFGSVEATRAALDEFRAKARRAGLPGLHINAVDWGCDAALAKALGVDSVASYVWIHHAGLPQQPTDYNSFRDQYFDFWTNGAPAYGIPYIPNVTMGWDPSPRADQTQELANAGYPFMNTVANNTPENFETALRMAKERILADPRSPRILNINCWNEWTEGSYLEPDTVHGTAYLDAVKKLFGTDLEPSKNPSDARASGAR